ncbi:hypothetical protein TNCV_4543871 [Trichonephila clavipes]|nr:hypothetical protein TNCV_4543871 [Trichonephila clavipes]
MFMTTTTKLAQKTGRVTEQDVMRQLTPAGWRCWFVTGLVRLNLWIRPSKSVDFHDAENRQHPCRMIVRHVKDPWSPCLTLFSAKLSPK